MNERIEKLALQAGLQLGTVIENSTTPVKTITIEQRKFAELIVKDYAKKTIQGLMSDPAFVQAMDEYYENKWSHRFD